MAEAGSPVLDSSGEGSGQIVARTKTRSNDCAIALYIGAYGSAFISHPLVRAETACVRISAPIGEISIVSNLVRRIEERLLRESGRPE